MKFIMGVFVGMAVLAPALAQNFSIPMNVQTYVNAMAYGTHIKDGVESQERIRVDAIGRVICSDQVHP